jgi:hypothetical protein
MLDVRSRAGVIAVTTSAAVLVGLPVVAFGQVPGVPQVVGGVTETADSLVQAPVAPPPLPAPAPAPAPAPVPAAPAPAPAPQVQAPAPPSAAPKPAAQAPAAQAPAAQAPAASNPGSAQARSAGTATGSSGGSAKASARRSATAADRSSKGDGRRDERAKAMASGDAGQAPTEQSAAGSEPAFASQGVDELPDDASPANLPFTGLQLALMAIIGVAALVVGVALRRGVLRSQRAGIVP